jgi:hypothetical protein
LVAFVEKKEESKSKKVKYMTVYRSDGWFFFVVMFDPMRASQSTWAKPLRTVCVQHMLKQFSPGSWAGI